MFQKGVGNDVLLLFEWCHCDKKMKKMKIGIDTGEGRWYSYQVCETQVTSRVSTLTLQQLG
ncbi:MAG: hypothetical protein IJF07_04130 [Lachnospiraceae bacterium]|nr:hypothetical protein [Lachnospiraceae bacterium]